MNPKNFNLFRNNLEETPKSKPEAHFVVNDAAKKLINNEILNEDENDLIKNIYIELQELDRGIASLLENYLSKSIITSEESRITASYILIAKQIGPNSDELRKAIYEGILTPIEIEEMAKSISIPENTRSVIISTYRKIYDHLQTKNP